MFEALMLEKRERKMSHPVLALAIHASLIACAIGARSHESLTGQPVIDKKDVIYIPAAPGTTSEVESAKESPLLRPVVCDCPIDPPGPILVPDPVVGKGVIPGLPGLDPDGRQAPGFLDSGPPPLSGVYREGDLTDSPAVVHFPHPVYPAALKAAGIEGIVQIEYVVNPEGRVEPGSIHIVSTDHPLMAESVHHAIREARFRPGKVRGIAVRTLVRQVVRFSLMSL
jgi:TonB family protein